jgi:hypothetical protein
MATQNELRDIARLAVADFNLDDDALDKYIGMVLRDIAIRTDVFKKRCAYKFKEPPIATQLLDFENLTKQVIGKEIATLGGIQWYDENKVLGA